MNTVEVIGVSPATHDSDFQVCVDTDTRFPGVTINVGKREKKEIENWLSIDTCKVPRLIAMLQEAHHYLCSKDAHSHNA